MKTYNHTPPIIFCMLTAAQKQVAIQKMAARHDIMVQTLIGLIEKPDTFRYNPDVDFEFYVVNGDIAVKEKRA